jgi:hypothetical protein
LPRQKDLGKLRRAGGQWAWLVSAASLATAVACGPSTAPELAGLTDQVAQVGTELVIDLAGTDVDGDHLRYGVHAADLPALDATAITESPSGVGVFRWTPLAADVGAHAVDFTVSDGSHAATATITIDVRSAIGAATAPVFRQPLGTGTTLDLARDTCVNLDIVVDDEDTAAVEIAQDEPLIEGAELTVRDGTSATWRWCPTRAQQGEPRYTLALSADDGDNPRTTKEYLIVLRGGTGTSCPGAAPVIAHTPSDASSIVDLTIRATIRDDAGIKDAPLLYTSLAPPALPLDLGRLEQHAMRTVSGDRKDGVYAGDVPNPVAQMPAGTRQTLYYVIVAADDDDPTGSCDHETVSQVYAMTVTSTGAADLPICAACTSDAQCGAGDECVRMGAAAAPFCLQACGSGCPAGYTCSASPLTSIDGASARQCVPDTGSCSAPTTACVDDRWEVNDTRSDAAANPVLAPDTYDLVSCPSTTSATRANDDWYKLVVAADARVDLQLAGGPATDLDLHLYHADGTVVTASTSLDPDEEINACLPAATYYVKVNGFGHARNAYLMSYDTHPEACATACVDDGHEDDDTYSQARETAYPSYASTGNAICPGDDDWYRVELLGGETMTVDLTFTQASAQQDLDLHLYQDSVDLTPCSPEAPATCTRAHGQGATSNEHTVFTAPASCGLDGCVYDVVVRGFAGSTNTYGLAIEIE